MTVGWCWRMAEKSNVESGRVKIVTVKGDSGTVRIERMWEPTVPDAWGEALDGGVDQGVYVMALVGTDGLGLRRGLTPRSTTFRICCMVVIVWWCLLMER